MPGLPPSAPAFATVDAAPADRAALAAPASSTGRRPELLRVLALVLPWALLWLLWLALSACSPPFDNVEQLTWVRSLQWATTSIRRCRPSSSRPGWRCSACTRR
jgi:hypothetical protein